MTPNIILFYLCHPDDLENGSNFDGVLSSLEPNKLIDIRREWDFTDILDLFISWTTSLACPHERDSASSSESPSPSSMRQGYAPVHGATVSVQSNVPVMQQTRVQTLYTYPVNTHVEYPSTSAKGSIGHLCSVTHKVLPGAVVY
ncbi:hypothetical protein JB92DRAFT_2847811 [Gautieria morchelliformis]|nr:hypothetical protein JB92DRAFT_2847811 [Gautieria morchelliformis]